MLPYLMSGLGDGLDCQTIGSSLSSNYDQLNRMIELRMEDTRQLERQLRRAPKDPEQYLDIIGLQTMKGGQND